MLLADRGIAMSSDELAVFAEAPRELPYVNVHHFLVGIGVALVMLSKPMTPLPPLHAARAGSAPRTC